MCNIYTRHSDIKVGSRVPWDHFIKHKMFSRVYGKYRRARKYVGNRLRRGRSLIQTKSKARSSTRVYPYSKKRSSNMAFSQNMSEDDWKDLGQKPPQSGHSLQAPLSMVRFKDPASSVFDYHHITRRVQQSDMIISGATGAQAAFSLNSTL